MRAGGCPAVVAQWQSTGSSSQRCPGFDSQRLLAFSFPLFSPHNIFIINYINCYVQTKLLVIFKLGVSQQKARVGLSEVQDAWEPHLVHILIVVLHKMAVQNWFSYFKVISNSTPTTDILLIKCTQCMWLSTFMKSTAFHYSYPYTKNDSAHFEWHSCYWPHSGIPGADVGERRHWNLPQEVGT